MFFLFRKVDKALLLAVNISNSQITLGGYEADRLLFCARVHTDRQWTSDEYAVQFSRVLTLYGYDASQINGVISSCVVPSLADTVRRALGILYAGRIYTVGPGLKTGLAMRMDDPAQLGGELVCCAVAARAVAPLPCVVVLMDTAISMVALDEKGVLCGGAILPGVRTGYDALCARTAQLTQFELRVPASGVLGTNSAACMQAGAVFGTASMLDGMLRHFSQALHGPVSCVATGSFVPVITKYCCHPVQYKEHLILEGLRLLYEKNVR